MDEQTDRWTAFQKTGGRYSFSTNVHQTAVKDVFVWDYFQQWINTRLVHSYLRHQDSIWGINLNKLQCPRSLYEGTCHVFWETMEVKGRMRKIFNIGTLKITFILLA